MIARLHRGVSQTNVCQMKWINIFLVIGTAIAPLGGCGLVDRLTSRPDPVVAATPAVAPSAPEILPPLGEGQTAATLDQSSEDEKAAALAAPAAGGAAELGKVVVSLGSPAEQGFWLRTALVTAPGKGRVVTAGGASANVDLIPGTGGAQLSLAAFRALNLSLTDLPEVTVFAN